MSKNYIEVAHEYVDEDLYRVTDFYYAVREPDSKMESPKGREIVLWENGWEFKAEISSLEDLAGYRKLLDAIEVRLKGLRDD